LHIFKENKFLWLKGITLLYIIINIGLFFLLRTSFWGFENQDSKHILSNRKLDIKNPDYSFSLASHIGDSLVSHIGDMNDNIGYEHSSSFDIISNYVIREKLDALFILGDIGKNIESRINKDRDIIPFRIELIPGNNDISNNEEYNKFVDRWGNYRSIQQDNILFILLNSMDCGSNYYPHEGCSMSESQVDFIEEALLNINNSIDHVFVMVHHIYWWNELDTISRLKLSKYSELRIDSIYKKLVSNEIKFKSAIVILLKKLLFFGNHVVFGRNDSKSSTGWFKNIHQILDDLDQNVFVIGGDSPFNGNIIIDGIHYINTGFTNYYWNTNGKEIFTIKVKRKHFQLESLSLIY
tara:strand:+ start:980 stop:2035 length:1056 start_codon:yes stop_codon:yes gene_type:complete